MDSWIRSLFAGLLLAGIAIAALAGWNIYGQEWAALIEQYTGLSDSLLVIVVLLVFLVGFALGFPRQAEQFENITVNRRSVFASPSARIKPTLDHSEVEEIDYVQEAYISYLQDRIRDLDHSKPIILKVKLYPPSPGDIPFLHRGGHLQRDTLLYYLEKLKDFENFKYMIVVDWFNRFQFFAKAKEFREQIEPIDGSHIIDLMNGYRIKELSEMPLFNSNWITNHTSNLRVLQTMAKNDINEVMVVSHTWGRRYLGVTELSKLLGRMLTPKKHREHRPILRASHADRRDKNADPLALTSDDERAKPDS